MDWSPLAVREVFHLEFLRSFTRAVKPSLFALKGGSNLRFFFGSIRYSEDMDLDLAGMPVHEVSEKVLKVLAAPSFASTLRSFGVVKVEPPDLASAKSLSQSPTVGPRPSEKAGGKERRRGDLAEMIVEVSREQWRSGARPEAPGTCEAGRRRGAPGGDSRSESTGRARRSITPSQPAEARWGFGIGSTQTETVQRFKVHLHTDAGLDLYTKIEFSRRGLESAFRAESVAPPVLGRYRLPPLIVSHYLAGAALCQKARALASRKQVEPRDVFDLYTLSTQPEASDPSVWDEMESAQLAEARERLFMVTYSEYRDKVVSFLHPDDQAAHDSQAVWDEIRLRVDQLLSTGTAGRGRGGKEGGS